jgi:ketol-acid reductoisomerase
MKRVLAEIQSGTFTKRLIDDDETGGTELAAFRKPAPTTRSRRSARSCGR